MTDKFLNTGGSGTGDITNGTINVYAATLAADNLDPSKPLKTNFGKQLISTNLEITDVNNLQPILDTVITNPLTEDLDLSNNHIVNLAEPLALQDGATKNYVDTEISNIPSSNIASATQIYVNPTLGNDGTGLRGDSTKPFLTLAAAVAASSAGDHIICAAGDIGGATITYNLTITGVVSNGNPATFCSGVVDFDIGTATGVNITGIGFNALLTVFTNSAATAGNRFQNCTFKDFAWNPTGTFTGGTYYQNCYINGEWTIRAFVILSECSGSSAQKYTVYAGTFLVENHVSTLGNINHFGGTVDINDVQSFNNTLGGNVGIYSQVDTGIPLTQFLIIRNCYLIDGITNLSLEIAGSVNIGLALYNTNILDANLTLTGSYTDVAVVLQNNGRIEAKSYSQAGEGGQLVITERAGTTDNIIIGDAAPSLQVGGTNNVYIGNGTATGQLTGDRNCFIGNVVMNNNTGSDNVAVGFNNQCFGNQNGIIMFGAGCSTNTSSVMCIGQNVQNLVPNSVKIGLFNTVNIRSNTVDTTDLGMSTERFKDLYMIGGIKNNQGSVIDMSTLDTIDLQATNVLVNGSAVGVAGDFLRLDGTTTMTGNINMGEQNISGLGLIGAPHVAKIETQGLASNIHIGSGNTFNNCVNAISNYSYGHGNMQALTNGSDNIAFGASCLNSITDQQLNVAIGTGSGANCTGNNNIFIGGDTGVAGIDNTIVLGYGARSLVDRECVIGTENLGTALTHIRPGRDNITDLGTGTYQYKDLYLSGTANADTLNVNTLDVGGDTLGNYLKRDGTNAMTATLDMGNNDLGSVKNIVANSPATPILIDSTGGVETNGKITLTGLDKSLNGIKTINRADPLEPINIISESNVEVYGGLYVGGVSNRRPVSSSGYVATGVTALTGGVETSMIPTGIGSLTVDAGSIKVGSCTKVTMAGDVTSSANNQQLRLRLKINAVTVSTFDVDIDTITGGGEPWQMCTIMTCRTDGAVGTMVINSIFTYVKNNLDSKGSGNRTVFNINTTIPNTFSLTMQWIDVDPGNTVGVDQFISTNVYQP